MDNIRDFLMGSIDKIYTNLQGIELPVKPNNVRVMGSVFSELEAMYKLLTEDHAEPAEAPEKEDGDV